MIKVKYIAKIAIPLILLGLIGGQLFRPLLDNPTHFDDIFHLGIPAVESTSPFIKFFIYNEDDGVTVPHRGIALLSHALINTISESKSYFLHYASNILLHVLNAFLLFLLIPQLFRILESDRKEVHSFMISGFTSVLFLVHPIQVNDVGYLAQRTMLLMTFFGLLTLITYISALLNEKKRDFYLFLAGLFFFAALYSKENIVTLLPVLFFLSYIKTKNISASGKILIPFMLISLFYIFNAHFSTHTRLIDVSHWSYLLTESVVIIKYLGLLLLPLPSRLNFDWDITVYSSLLDISVVTSITAIICLISLGIYQITRSNKIIGFCLLWFFITLSPDSSFFPLPEPMVEYRLYFPSIGIFFFIGYILLICMNFLKINERIRIGIFTLVGISISGLCTYVTIERLKVLDTEIGFWTDVIEKSPYKMRGYINRGFAYQENSEAKLAYKDYSKAIELNNDKHDPGMAYLNRATLYLSFNLLKDAAKDYTSALEINKEDRTAYAKRGVIYGKMGRFDEAIEDFTAAINLPGKNSSIYFQRGVAYVRKNESKRAIQDFNRAISETPEANIYLFRGEAYEDIGRIDKAQKDYAASCKLGRQEACDRVTE